MFWAARLTLLGLTAVWSISLAVIEIGLREVPPLLFCSVRFALVAFPSVLFLQTPGAHWLNVMVARYTPMVPVFGQLGANWLLGEPMQRRKLVAAALVFAGLGVDQFGQAVTVRLRRPWTYQP